MHQLALVKKHAFTTCMNSLQCVPGLAQGALLWCPALACHESDNSQSRSFDFCFFRHSCSQYYVSRGLQIVFSLHCTGFIILCSTKVLLNSNSFKILSGCCETKRKTHFFIIIKQLPFSLQNQLVVNDLILQMSSWRAALSGGVDFFLWHENHEIQRPSHTAVPQTIILKEYLSRGCYQPHGVLSSAGAFPSPGLSQVLDTCYEVVQNFTLASDGAPQWQQAFADEYPIVCKTCCIQVIFRWLAQSLDGLKRHSQICPVPNTLGLHKSHNIKRHLNALSICSNQSLQRRVQKSQGPCNGVVLGTHLHELVHGNDTIPVHVHF